MQSKAPYNEKGERHGFWEIYYENGGLYYKVNFVNNKWLGYGIFNLTGNHVDKEYYAR